MRLTAYGRVRVAVVVVAIGVLMSGCSSVAAGGQPTSGHTEGPTASSSPASVRTEAPACTALATQEEVVQLVGGSGEPQKFEHLQPGAVHASWAVLAGNGAVCGWGVNGLHDLIGATGSPSVFVQLMPGLESAWNELATELSPSAGASYDGAVSRGGDCASSFCSTNVLVDGAWLVVQASGGDTTLDQNSFHTFVQGLVTRYHALPAPTVVKPHAPRSCDDPAVTGAVEQTLGGPSTLSEHTPSFELKEALQRAGYQTFCMFFGPDRPHGYETDITVIDGASDALLQEYRTGVDHPLAQTVDASSLPGSASALQEETVDSHRTIVDVLDDGHWVDVTTYPLSDTAVSVKLAGTLIAGSWVR